MKNLLLFFLILNFFSAYSQDKLPVTTTQSQIPPEGVYFLFSSVKNGKPDLLKNNLKKSVYNPEMTIRQWSMTENLNYAFADSVAGSLNRDSLWGYSENGNVHIYLGGKFHKITLFGSISYFLESYPTIKGIMAPVVTDKQGSSYYRILDMETGDLYDYSPETVETLLERDEVLHKEFISIEKIKSRRKKMYSFMERFNALHPVYPE